MDRDKLIGLIQKKHNTRLSPDDPVFVSASIFEAYAAEMRDELANLVEVANAKAEAAATAKVNAIISQSGEWAAQKIQEAGDVVVTRIQSAQATTSGPVEVAASRAERFGRLAVGSAALSAALVVGGLIALFKL